MLKHNILCWLSLIFISVAWHFPGELSCVILTWIGTLLLVTYLPQVKRPYSVLYSAGICLYSIGFYWLFYTIRDFGGFSNLIALLIFLLFVIVSAVQFLMIVFVWRNLPRFLHTSSLALPLAWFSAEILSFKIFPWCLGHAQIGFTYLAQVGEIAGAPGVSVLVLAFSDAIVKIIQSRKVAPARLAIFILFTASLLFGYQRTKHFRETEYPKQNVTLVQANISLEDKHDSHLAKRNLEQYINLSKPYAERDTILLWPETALTEFIPAAIRSVQDDTDERLPYFKNTPILFGGLTFESRKKFFNSAIGISGDGNISGIYHKQVLMPFGEYTPFSETFPWLKDINSTAGEFSAGSDIKVLEFKTISGNTIKITPLICYEDLMPELSSKAVKKGSEILVNLTNDAWFGNTIAPYQHNLIASFRSIETRRFLLRSTNTGLTAIVNPLGETTAHLVPYTQGVLNQDISKIAFPAISSYYDMQYILKIAAFLILGVAIISRLLNDSRQPQYINN